MVDDPLGRTDIIIILYPETKGHSRETLKIESRTRLLVLGDRPFRKTAGP